MQWNALLAILPKDSMHYAAAGEIITSPKSRVPTTIMRAISHAAAFPFSGACIDLLQRCFTKNHGSKHNLDRGTCFHTGFHDNSKPDHESPLHVVLWLYHGGWIFP